MWEVDPAGEEPSRRLTHGPTGESQPAFTSEGDLLFVAKRGTDLDAEQTSPGQQDGRRYVDATCTSKDERSDSRVREASEQTSDSGKRR